MFDVESADLISLTLCTFLCVDDFDITARERLTS